MFWGCIIFNWWNRKSINGITSPIERRLNLKKSSMQIFVRVTSFIYALRYFKKRQKVFINACYNWVIKLTKFWVIWFPISSIISNSNPMIETRFNQNISLCVFIAAIASFLLSLFLFQLFAVVLIILWLVEKSKSKRTITDWSRQGKSCPAHRSCSGSARHQLDGVLQGI